MEESQDTSWHSLVRPVKPPRLEGRRQPNHIHKAPDKQRICVFTQLKQREYAIKLIYVRTKTQTKFVGTQFKKFQKRNIRIPSVYATIAVSNCKQLSGTNFSEKLTKFKVKSL